MQRTRRPAVWITMIAMFSALAFALMKFPKIPLPFFPSFLEFEFSELPVIVLGLLLGPWAAALAELIKNLIDLMINPVGLGVGQLANFSIGVTFVVPLLLLYRRKRTTRAFLIGAGVSLVTVICVACVLNAFVLTPLYARAYGAPIDLFVEMAAKVNGLVTDYRSYIFFAIAPFNLVKFTVCAILSYFLVTALKPALKRLGF